MRIGFTTICVPTDLHRTLEGLKVHPRQPYHEVIAAALQVATRRRRSIR